MVLFYLGLNFSIPEAPKASIVKSTARNVSTHNMHI